MLKLVVLAELAYCLEETILTFMSFLSLRVLLVNLKKKPTNLIIIEQLLIFYLCN